MTNFEYYIASGKEHEGWRKFYDKDQFKVKGDSTINKYNNWLLEEHEESILDDIEKKYLSNIIKPFRDRVKCISKEGSEITSFIRIGIKDDFAICLPYFYCSTKMYANMKVNKKYTLKELGL